MYFFFVQGGKIHATIRKTLIYKFEKELKEGMVYSINFFGVVSNGGNFRTTRHGYKLNFQMGTKVVSVDNGLVSASPFSIVLFSDITETYSTDYLVGK